MVVKLDFNFDPLTGRIIQRPTGQGKSGMDASSWVQNIAYDYQTANPASNPAITTGPMVSPSPSSFGKGIADILLAGPRLLLAGVNQTIDGVKNAIMYPPGFQVDPANPNAPRYTQYGVPFNPALPGTSPGPGSGFLQQKVFGDITGGQIAIGLAALAGVILLAKATK